MALINFKVSEISTTLIISRHSFLPIFTFKSSLFASYIYHMSFVRLDCQTLLLLFALLVAVNPSLLLSINLHDLKGPDFTLLLYSSS